MALYSTVTVNKGQLITLNGSDVEYVFNGQSRVINAFVKIISTTIGVQIGADCPNGMPANQYPWPTSTTFLTPVSFTNQAGCSLHLSGGNGDTVCVIW